MPKAVITTKQGATVAIEGSEAEVRALLGLFERDQRKPELIDEQRAKPRVKARPTPMGLLSDLIADGFLATPKDLGTVRLALEERGHFYPVTTLSPLMLRLVRRKELRRIKDKKRWTYVC